MQYELQWTTCYNITRRFTFIKTGVYYFHRQDYYLDSIVIIITFKIIIILCSWQETIRKDFISRSHDFRVYTRVRKRNGGNDNFMVRKVKTTSGNEERDGPAAHWENRNCTKVQDRSLSHVSVRACTRSTFSHMEAHERARRRGRWKKRIRRHRDRRAGIGGASGNGTADEGSNSDGVRTKPRSDFHSYSEITGRGTLVARSFDGHPIISRCQYTLTAYIRSPWNLAIHTYESADVSFRIGEWFRDGIVFLRDSRI